MALVELEFVAFRQPTPTGPGPTAEMVSRATADGGWKIVMDTGGADDVTISKGEQPGVSVPRAAVLCYRRRAAAKG